ncbi:AraC family transcriptional regulator ligand-binding domain-containing protein [Vibrio renipiscarius]|uniref:AraC family transcriptional regulator n=1 Tax=Vibrio renipiscarius TaxID=1461322 RepID=UPI00354D1D14
MNRVRFIRALGVRNVHNQIRRRYGLDANALAIPESALQNPMTLIPLSEVNRWYQSLETATGNCDVILDVASEIKPNDLGVVSRWLLSGIDLASAIRRLNYGISSLQSGAFLSGSQSGHIVKWEYYNPFIDPQNKVHDSVRAAVFMTKMIRYYAGDSYTPMRVMMSGIRKSDDKYKQYFGCDIGWNHSKTEIWFHTDLLLSTQSMRFARGTKPLAMNFADLDEFLNMPAPDDEIKVIYELINYSCHYGFPTVEKVASLIGLSAQQFQRRLHAIGMNFTNVMGYVMSNIAVELMVKGVSSEEVARRLGYKNVASFNRMFKKHRDLTPKQFIQHLV